MTTTTEGSLPARLDWTRSRNWDRRRGIGTVGSGGEEEGIMHREKKEKDKERGQ